ncbi:MAG: hypothetical protein KatS3mg082_1187 [Nitrospiraceae bacterium]|nr:MAG: hypothetical protein KatS3mg082_1187 [Nitrospiraceae bacterium]
MFDNLGTESLTTVFLKKISPDPGETRKGLIIVIDASFPFDAGRYELDGSTKGFEVFKDDPSRIVGIMEERANSYQAMLWHSLRVRGGVLPEFGNLRLVVLKHTDADWEGYDDLPDACRSEFPPRCHAGADQAGREPDSHAVQDQARLPWRVADQGGAQGRPEAPPSDRELHRDGTAARAVSKPKGNAVSASAGEQGPFRLSQVLAEEYERLHGSRVDFPPEMSEPERLKAIYRRIHALPHGRAALCLSGGGIRSATFGLGVIQGLARVNLLDKFDYLSTVSGGGYIGSWLTAWIKHHPRGLAGVTQELSVLARAPLEPEPDPGELDPTVQQLFEPAAGAALGGFLDGDRHLPPQPAAELAGPVAPCARRIGDSPAISRAGAVGDS